MNASAQSSRRVLPLVLVTTLVPAACLCWLGWKVVEDDRSNQQESVRQQREQAAELAASSLQRVIAEAEERLASFSAGPSVREADGESGVALMAFGPTGVVARAGAALPYYPGLPDPWNLLDHSPDLLDHSPFAAVDELELRAADLAGALGRLDALTASRDANVAGSALVRMARIQVKRGNVQGALEAYSRLDALGDVVVEGVPAGLAARLGRGLALKRARRVDDLRREAAALCDHLEAGRWMLSRAVFEHGYRIGREWLGSERPPLAVDRVALADAAEALWLDWHALRGRPPGERSRRTLQVGDVSVLALTRSTPDRHMALVMTPAFLESTWLDGLGSGGRVQNLDFAIIDADGRSILGRSGAPTSTHSVPLDRVGLPWTMHVITKTSGLSNGLSGQTRLVLAGIIVMALVALAGGYAINRAILRELRVARLQSDFVAAVSHEFRTPLTTVRQLAEMLVAGRVSSDDRRQQFYVTLLRESDRLHRLVEGLLNFGRMEAGQLQYRFEAVDSGAFVRDVVSDFEREVTGRGYHVELNGFGALPRIRADRESLARAFWNLLDNAVKYSPEHRTIWVDLSEANRRLAVRVRDRGIGIPVAEQKEIFKKFVRGAASKDASVQGAGVGLAMARQIVAAHGGEISVESQPGEGSVFTVLLPVAEA